MGNGALLAPLPHNCKEGDSSADKMEFLHILHIISPEGWYRKHRVMKNFSIVDKI
jgi:hypothetical protein